MTLVSHLRSDNLRLREALIRAQRDAEEATEAALERGQQTVPGVDFAHLLALAKELGDGLGGIDAGDAWWGVSDDPAPLEPPSTARLFSIGSPRGEKEEAPAAHREAPLCPTQQQEKQQHQQQEEGEEEQEVRLREAHLQKELEASRREVERLKAELTCRDAELAALRASGSTLCQTFG